MLSLEDQFERVYVINLSRRRQRGNEFFRRVPKSWPFRFPELYHAVDGAQVSPPSWWKGGKGSWGCYKTHVRILEDCLNDNISSVLILEDDAVFVEHFREKVELFWRHLPEDWEMIYLGGQHLQENIRLPRKVNEWVYRPYNVNRTHCYGFHHRIAIEKTYRHLHDFPGWKVKHHVDHYLGELHKRMEGGLYVPREWLVTQAGGISDVCHSEVRERIFPGSEELVYPPVTKKGIAVLGDYFGGSNTLAGLLFHLGISPGSDMPLETEKGAPCCFEDVALREICRGCFEEPRFAEKLVAEDRCNHLRRWAGRQCSVQAGGRYFWGKHPLLCLMGAELSEAWNHPYFLVADRPVEESLAVLNRQSRAWSSGDIKGAMSQLRDTREDFLARRHPTHLRVPFVEISNDPEKTIRRICEFLDHRPTLKQKYESLRFLRAARDDVSFGYLKRPNVITKSQT